MIMFYYPNGLPINMPHCDPETQITGYLPLFFDANDPAPAAEQINRHYIGGWHPFPGFMRKKNQLKYPGDPPMKLLAFAHLRTETLKFYEGSWLAIIQKDGSIEIARVD